MFRERDPQVSLWQSEFLVPPKKARRLERSWAEVFRNEALPLIDEERFALMYCADNGRPNRAVQTVLGVHLLKEMFNLTDDEALEQLEFNLLWHHALRLDMEETHLPQKTLHNFRVRLMQHDGGRLAFQETTERIIQALGIRTGKQRLDSTHIMSNIATLTRLGLFCETMRLFLRAVGQEHPELRRVVPEGLVGRYLKEEDEATDYEDARSGEGRRRLGVCTRDLYRLVDGFRGTTAAQLEGYRLLERLLREQCVVGNKRDGRPGEDDDDAGEEAVPITLRDPKEVRSDSLQSPHDPEATYSGHKGKGYEVQVAETCHEENATQLITHVEVTPSSGSDTNVTVPLVDGLAERKVRPDELFADTAYGSGRNAFEASRRGTELVSPVAGSAPGNSHEGEGDGPPPLTGADFQIDVTGEQSTVCPAGHRSVEEYELEDAGTEKEKTALLCVLGTREDGEKELLAMVPGYRESTESWAEVLRDLRDRGLSPPLLAVGDGALGLWAALDQVFPATDHQRCWNHRALNVRSKLPKRLQADVRGRLREMTESETQALCEERRDTYVAELRSEGQGGAAETVLRDWEDFVTFYHYPKEHWVHLRTSNPIESIFSGVRLRTNAARRIRSRENALHLVFKMVERLSGNWRALNGGENLMALVLAGCGFEDGILNPNPPKDVLGDSP